MLGVRQQLVGMFQRLGQGGSTTAGALQNANCRRAARWSWRQQQFHPCTAKYQQTYLITRTRSLLNQACRIPLGQSQTPTLAHGARGVQQQQMQAHRCNHCCTVAQVNALQRLRALGEQGRQPRHTAASTGLLNLRT